MATAVCTFVAAVASSQVGSSINWNHSLRFLYMALTPRRRDVWADKFCSISPFPWQIASVATTRCKSEKDWMLFFLLCDIQSFFCMFTAFQLFSIIFNDGKRGRCVNNSWLLILTLRLFQQQWLPPFWSFDLWMFKCCPGPRHRPGDGVPAQEAVNILQWWEYSPRQIVRILARQCLYLTIRRRAFLLGEDTLGYLWHQWYKPSIFSIALTTIANYIGVIDFEILVESDIMWYYDIIICLIEKPKAPMLHIS